MISLGKLIKLLLSSCLIFLQVLGSLAESDGRIVGGYSTTIDQAPYLVQIKSEGRLLCGGTLVTRRHVVSAAHCFVDNPTELVIVGGATKITENGAVRSNVSRVLVHRKFNTKSYDMDIAVIRLETPMKAQSIKPISLDCQEEWAVGQTVRLFGWGQLDEDTEAVPIDLQTVEVEVFDKNKCTTNYRFQRNITESMVCASAPGRDSCSGDSGGPATIKNQLCGVVSWGTGCAQEYAPGVYTDLKVVKGFIKKAIKILK